MAIHLFPDFLENKNVYSLNVEHWSRLLHSITDAKGMLVKEHTFTTTFTNGNYFLDGNPIFEAIIDNYRAVRIIQQAPESDELNISAWIDQREVNGQLIDELVIDLELTEESQSIVRNFFLCWLVFRFSLQEMIKIIDIVENRVNSSHSVVSVSYDEKKPNNQRDMMSNFELIFTILGLGEEATHSLTSDNHNQIFNGIHKAEIKVTP